MARTLTSAEINILKESLAQGVRMTLKTIYLAVPGCAELQRQGNPFFDSTPFMSICPRCNEPRLQLGYSRWGLLTRLEGDRPIEAGCVICDQLWPITPSERMALARELQQLQMS
ncbi:MAG: hypothetical protein JO299_07645 [Gammaproteobacteria bacterium]|nr:hypothetical protein [Gammaproteobacteria bacterium]